ncbi:hypothetical protein ACFPM0_35915 [Pseudonocardia sulfidoxydans]|uniref:hypothetical protein n=1 Tax=Pseudonocardia sulfidoxydans TaxID=54011 RepID=UPI00361D380A
MPRGRNNHPRQRQAVVGAELVQGGGDEDVVVGGVVGPGGRTASASVPGSPSTSGTSDRCGATVGPSLASTSPRPSRVNAASVTTSPAGSGSGDNIPLRRSSISASLRPSTFHTSTARAPAGSSATRSRSSWERSATGDAIPAGPARVQRHREQRRPVAVGVGVQVDHAAGDAEPGLGDGRAAGDELGADAGAQVDELEMAVAAAAVTDHDAVPVARHRAHHRGGPGRQHRRRAVAQIHETRLPLAATLAVHRDTQVRAARRPRPEHDRRRAGRDLVAAAAVGGDQQDAGAFTSAGGQLAGQPRPVGRPGDTTDVRRREVRVVEIGGDEPGRLDDRPVDEGADVEPRPPSRSETHASSRPSGPARGPVRHGAQHVRGRAGIGHETVQATIRQRHLHPPLLQPHLQQRHLPQRVGTQVGAPCVRVGQHGLEPVAPDQAPRLRRGSVTASRTRSRNGPSRCLMAGTGKYPFGLSITASGTTPRPPP